MNNWIVDKTNTTMDDRIETYINGMNTDNIRYKAIKIIGKQFINGTKYALLAEQDIIDRSNTIAQRNAVIIIIYYENNDISYVSSIIPVCEGKYSENGILVDIQTEIPEQAQESFNSVSTKWFDKVKMVACLGMEDDNYIFIVNILNENDNDIVAMMVTNAKKGNIFIAPILSDVYNLRYIYRSKAYLNIDNVSYGEEPFEW